MAFLDKTGAELFAQKIKAKQDKIFGKSGQFAGFDANGKLVAVDAPSGGGEGGPVAWGDILNKPVVVRRDTLTWAAMNESQLDFDLLVGDTFYPFSDAIVTLDDLAAGGVVSVPAFDFCLPITEDYVFEVGEGVVMFCQAIVAVSHDNAVAEDEEMTFVFPKAGLYTVPELLLSDGTVTINGYTGFASEKFLPSYLYQADLNQTDPSQPDYIKGKEKLATADDLAVLQSGVEEAKSAAEQAQTVATNVQATAENALLIGNVAMPGSLKWDGVIGNKEVVIAGEEDAGGGLIIQTVLVRVSDYEPVALMFGEPGETIPAFASMSGASVGENAVELFELVLGEDGAILAEGLFYVPTDGYSLEGILTFPKKGWYFMAYNMVMADMGIEMPAMFINALWVPGVSFPDNSGGDASKYFEQAEVTSEVGDTLTWDGDTTGRLVVAVTAEMALVHISPNVPAGEYFADGLTVTGVNSGVEAEQVIPAESVSISEDGLITALPYIVATPTDNYDVDGVLFPQKGCYFLSVPEEGIYIKSITLPGYNFTVTTTGEVIKHEHLPEALRFGEVTTYGDTLTWDGDLNNASWVVGDETLAFARVSESVPTLAQLSLGGYLEGSSGETIEVTSADVREQQNGAITINFLDAVIAPEDVTANGQVYKRGVYFYYYPASGAYTKRLTINGYNGFKTKTLKKIDSKYLPAGGGGSGLPEVSTKDNGKFLRVVKGEWAVVALDNAEDGAF